MNLPAAWSRPSHPVHVGVCSIQASLRPTDWVTQIWILNCCFLLSVGGLMTMTPVDVLWPAVLANMWQLLLIGWDTLKSKQLLVLWLIMCHHGNGAWCTSRSTQALISKITKQNKTKKKQNKSLLGYKSRALKRSSVSISSFPLLCTHISPKGKQKIKGWGNI